MFWNSRRPKDITLIDLGRGLMFLLFCFSIPQSKTSLRFLPLSMQDYVYFLLSYIEESTSTLGSYYKEMRWIWCNMSMSYVKHKKQVTRQYVWCAFSRCFTLVSSRSNILIMGLAKPEQSLALTCSEKPN